MKHSLVPWVICLGAKEPRQINSLADKITHFPVPKQYVIMLTMKEKT
jgi:hypothetical protein